MDVAIAAGVDESQAFWQLVSCLAAAILSKFSTRHFQSFNNNSWIFIPGLSLSVR
jgi:hypothetical protein